MSTSTDEHDQRQPELQVGALAPGSCHTICRTSSTWVGLAPGGALKARGDLAVLMTRMWFDRPITSSSVSPSKNDGEAFGGHVAHQFIDILLGANIDAARRMIEDQDAHARDAPFGQNDLLLVAARQAPTIVLVDGVLMLSLSIQLFATAFSSEKRMMPPDTYFGRAASVMFSATLKGATRPSTLRSAGTRPTPLGGRVIGSAELPWACHRPSACRRRAWYGRRDSVPGLRGPSRSRRQCPELRPHAVRS